MKEFAFKLNGASYQCAVEQIEAGKAQVTVNGKVYEVVSSLIVGRCQPLKPPSE